MYCVQSTECKTFLLCRPCQLIYINYFICCWYTTLLYSHVCIIQIVCQCMCSITIYCGILPRLSIATHCTRRASSPTTLLPSTMCLGSTPCCTTAVRPAPLTSRRLCWRQFTAWGELVRRGGTVHCMRRVGETRGHSQQCSVWWWGALTLTVLYVCTCG